MRNCPTICIKSVKEGMGINIILTKQKKEKDKRFIDRLGERVFRGEGVINRKNRSVDCFCIIS